MALKKEKLTRYGIPASYWRLGTITIDRNMKEASFSLCLYVDKEAQDFVDCYSVTDLMGKEDKDDYYKYFEEMGEYTDISNACYMYAKENVEYFADAEDI